MDTTGYLLELFQSQTERGHYVRAENLLRLLALRLPRSEVDRLRTQIPELSLTDTEHAELTASVEGMLYDAKRRFPRLQGRHSFLKQEIGKLASKFGFRASIDYFPDIQHDGRYELSTDVVWLKGNAIVIAFEIDSNLRQRSVAKLAAIDAPHRIWVYFGNKNSRDFVSRFDPAGNIVVIDQSLQKGSLSHQGRIEARRLPVDTVRKQLIQEIVRRQKIRRLVHFTRACNVSSILEHGLLPRYELRTILGDQVESAKINDEFRYDHRKDANCLSISFPNYRMFRKCQLDNPDRSWAVLVIEPDILWEMDCAFCATNAASRSVSSMPLGELKSPCTLEALFADFQEGSTRVVRSELTIPEYFPTNPQAEVLVFGTIPPSRISAVHLRPRDTTLSKYTLNWKGVVVKYSRYYFRPRVDYEHWRQQ